MIDLSNREVLEDTALIVNEDVVNLINVDILDDRDTNANDDATDSYIAPSLDDSWEIVSDWDNDCNRDWILEVDWNSVR